MHLQLCQRSCRSSFHIATLQTSGTLPSLRLFFLSDFPSLRHIRQVGMAVHVHQPHCFCPNLRSPHHISQWPGMLIVVCCIRPLRLPCVVWPVMTPACDSWAFTMWPIAVELYGASMNPAPTSRFLGLFADNASHHMFLVSVPNYYPRAYLWR
jgi:hypothetical protein